MLRLPLAATTIADVWAGFFGSGQTFEPRLLAIHAAALAFYLGGMTLNDVFDAARDAEIHPDRPIPSGAIRRDVAAAQGAALLIAGTSLAALAGRGVPAAALLASIVAYDALLKRWRIPGALAMGACRYLDVQLGAGFRDGLLFWPAIALGSYVALVTLFSTLEDDPGRDTASWRAATRRLLFGIFLVDALSLWVLGHPALAVSAAALSATFPLLVRLLSRSSR